MSELLEDAELEQVRSIRSAERKGCVLHCAGTFRVSKETVIVKALLTSFHFKRKCGAAEEYLSFCNAFIEELAKVVGYEDYCTCLYDQGDERPYTTAYFAILVEEVLSRCRTYQWVNNEP